MSTCVLFVFGLVWLGGKQWLKLANGNDLTMEGAKSIGVHLLSRAAAFAGDNFGLYLPKAAINGRISVSQVKSVGAVAAWNSRPRLFLVAF